MKKIFLIVLVNIVCLTKAQITIITNGYAPHSPIRVINRHNDIWQNKLFYQGGGISTHPLSLVVSDGTAIGTKVVKNMSPVVTMSGTNDISGIREFRATDNWMYFTFENKEENRFELWRTDGTEANTIKVDEGVGIILNKKSKANGIDTRQGFFKTDANGILYYFKKTASGQMDLWKTNGFVGGSVLIKSNITNSGYYTIFAGNLYINSYAEKKLYKYDGHNWTVVVDLAYYQNNIHNDPREIVAVTNNKLYFIGIINQTLALHSIDANGVITNEYNWPNIQIDFQEVTGQSNSNGSYVKISKTVNNATKSFILYITNNLIKELEIPYNATIKRFEANDDVVYILGEKSTDDNFYFQRYTANLDFVTEAVYKMINGGSTIVKTGFYQNAFWMQFANVAISQAGLELWKSDGTQANTKMVKDLNTATNVSSAPENFFTINNKLYFFAMTSSGQKIIEVNGDYTFNNNTGNNLWSDPSNWNSTIVPSSVDLVNVPAAFTPQIDGNAFANNLNVSSPLNLTTGNLNVGGNLNLFANVTLNNNKLNLLGTSSNITNGNATNYIVTNGTGTVNVENLNAERGTVNLPIGTATNYNPVSIANTGTSDTFSARVSDGISNTTNGAVNATWEISEATAGGSNVSLTLGWNTSQQNAAFDSGTAKVGHYLNGNWAEENSGSVSNNSITATGISSFSPFAVMNFGTLAATDFSKSKVSVYPNPFNENLNISTENGGVVHFYDLSGKLVSTSILMKGTNSLNKSSLAKGVYIYQIRNTNGEVVSSGKVIKK